MSRWNEYRKKLLQGRNVINKNVDLDSTVVDIGDRTQEEEISLEEISAAINKLNKGKAPGQNTRMVDI